MGFQNDPSNLLYEAITTPKKKLAFFVGPGISVNSGLEDFKGFSKQFLGKIGPANWINEDNRDIDLITERLRPEVLLQVIEQVYGSNSLKFYSTLDSGIPNSNHYFLALALLKEHCVFTTNIDTLIEKACENIGIACAPIFYEKHYREFLKKPPIDFSSHLFKLHGSIEPNKAGLSKYKSIRFTLNRVGLGLDESAAKVLSTCLQERDFIFLGYSGNDHFSVHPVLLNVDSNQKIYWFKFLPMTALQYTSSSSDFQSQRNNLLKEASKDLSAAKWEDISLREVLIKWKSRSFLIEGNSSYAIKDILIKLISSNESPEYLKLNSKLENFWTDLNSLKCERKSSFSWVENITDFKRHLCAAMLWIRVRNLTKANLELKYAEECTKNDEEKAEVEKLRATTYFITRRIGKENTIKEDLLKAMKKFQMQGDLVAMIEAHLELANILRIERDFGTALKELDKIEKELMIIKPELQKQKKACDWFRLIAHLSFLQGFIYGLGLNGTLKDIAIGIEYCDKASEFAAQAGDVACKAAILNARGLIIYQLAERTNKMLQKAEDSLNEALVLYSRIRDPRGCFEPSYNLLLIYYLRLLQSRLKPSDYWLDKAWEEANRAYGYLNQIETGSDEPSRDQIELDFRIAQLLWLKGDKEYALSKFKYVLDYWEQKSDLHQQALIWHELLSRVRNQKEIQNCLSKLLDIIEVLFQSDRVCNKYKNDMLRLEYLIDILNNAYDKAYEIEDQEYLKRVKELVHRGKEISESILKGHIENIQEEAKTACWESQGTDTQGIACTINSEIQRWKIGSLEEMASNMENLIFTLESSVPRTPKNQYIFNRIQQIREQKDIAKQYGILSTIISLIPRLHVEMKISDIKKGIDEVNEKATTIIKKLDEIQKELDQGFDKLDLLSLDIGGKEGELIKSFSKQVRELTEEGNKEALDNFLEEVYTKENILIEDIEKSSICEEEKEESKKSILNIRSVVNRVKHPIKSFGKDVTKEIIVTYAAEEIVKLVFQLMSMATLGVPIPPQILSLLSSMTKELKS